MLCAPKADVTIYSSLKKINSLTGKIGNSIKIDMLVFERSRETEGKNKVDWPRIEPARIWPVQRLTTCANKATTINHVIVCIITLESVGTIVNGLNGLVQEGRK